VVDDVLALRVGTYILKYTSGSYADFGTPSFLWRLRQSCSNEAEGMNWATTLPSNSKPLSEVKNGPETVVLVGRYLQEMRSLLL
jgi:hypothetical protein